MKIIRTVPTSRMKARCGRAHAGFPTAPRVFLLLLICIFCAGLRDAGGLPPEQVNGPVNFQIDETRYARITYAAMPVMPSIMGFFGAFDTLENGGRKPLFSGPWQTGTMPGRLSRNPSAGGPGGEYAISSNDDSTGAYYRITYKQAAPDELFVSFEVRMPSRAANPGFECEICKILGDFFKGASASGVPSISAKDAVLPLIPRPPDKSHLYENKKEITLKGRICDIRIRDLAGDDTINLADCRNSAWDRIKSFYIYCWKTGLVPGKLYRFSYSIRFSPPSLPANEKKASRRMISEGAQGSDNFSRFLAIKPKEYKALAGRHRFTDGELVFAQALDVPRAMLISEIKRRTGLSIREAPPAGKPSGGIIIEDASKAEGLPPAKGLHPDGYELSISADRIVIRGRGVRGCLYGVYALLGKIRLDKGIWAAPCGTERDWPDLPVRGMCIRMSASPGNDLKLLRRYVRALSFARANLVIFNFNPEEVQRWSAGGGRNEWTPEEAAEIADYARSLGFEVWAGMGSTFDAGVFPALDVREGANIYNPLDGRSYDLLFALYENIIKIIKPTVVLINHDEVKGLCLYAGDGPGATARLFARDITKIHDWLAARKTGTAMWGDMLLDNIKWASLVGDANSNNPLYNSGATHPAIDLIPKDVKILDWHYNEMPGYPSIGYFREKGFQVYGSSWYDPRAAKGLAESVKRYHGQGLIGNDFALLFTLSLPATTLYTTACGWSTRCGLGQNDVGVLAANLRAADVLPMKGLRQVPVDLKPFSNRSTWDISAGSGMGLFGTGPLLDLRELTPGRQVMGGVTYDLPPAGEGRNNNCIVVSGDADVFPAAPPEALIPINGQFARQIAFLQTAYIEDPRVNPRRIGEYVIEFRDGREVSVSLQENVNITDVRSSEGLRSNPWGFSRSPDELLDSLPGWRGVSWAGLPLNLQVFIWRNPYPSERIEAIRFRAFKQPDRLQLALLGLTLLQ